MSTEKTETDGNKLAARVSNIAGTLVVAAIVAAVGVVLSVRDTVGVLGERLGSVESKIQSRLAAASALTERDRNTCETGRLQLNSRINQLEDRGRAEAEQSATIREQMRQCINHLETKR